MRGGGKESIWDISLPLSLVTVLHLLCLAIRHPHVVTQLLNHLHLPPSYMSTPLGDKEKGIAALLVHLQARRLVPTTPA